MHREFYVDMFTYLNIFLILYICGVMWMFVISFFFIFVMRWCVRTLVLLKIFRARKVLILSLHSTLAVEKNQIEILKLQKRVVRNDIKTHVTTIFIKEHVIIN